MINPDNEIINLDIWPLSGVETFEAAFPAGFDPDPMSCTPLGVEDISHSLNFQIFPNPSDGSSFNLKLADDINTAEVIIYNILGKIVYSNRFDSNVITINTELASGTYIVNVTSEMGSIHKSLIVK